MSTPFIPLEKMRLSCMDGINREFTLDSSLIQRWQSLEDESFFTIVETKFDAGFNFLSTWQRWLQEAPPTAKLHFFSCDSQPLSASDLMHILDRYPELAPQSRILLNEYPVLTPGFHHLAFEEGRVNLTLMLGPILTSLNELLYCADSVLERNLRLHPVDSWLVNHDDSEVDKGKLADVMAQLSNQVSPSDKRSLNRKTPWHIAQPLPLSSKQAIIVGAGLAGCCVANKLANRGWQITLLDKHLDLAQGASGHPQAILYPNLSAFCSPLTQFMLSSYLYAHQFYSKWLKSEGFGELNGIIQLAHNQKELISQTSLYPWLTSYPQLGKLVDAHEASLLAGIPLSRGGLFLPLSGWIETKALCHRLIQHPNITFVSGYPIEALQREQECWSVGVFRAETVILANGYQANQFMQTKELPLKPVAGQLTRIVSNEQIKQIKIPICGDGHLFPEQNNHHILGATFHQGMGNENVSADDRQNLEKFKDVFETISAKDVVGNWRGIRAATPDYLPLVGQVPDSEAFTKHFASLSSDSKRWIGCPGEYHHGLFMCAGFGSRGLTTIPLATEWLASLINSEPVKMPQSLMRALSPARFLIKKIVKG